MSKKADEKAETPEDEAADETEAADEGEDEDEDEEVGADEEDEEDEEEEPRAAAPAAQKAAHRAPAPPMDDQEDPTWWLPHAVLATLVLLGVAGFFGAFSGLVKSPLSSASASASAAVSAGPAKTAAAPTARPTAPPKPGAPTADPAEAVFSAKQILVGYKDAKRSKATRTKDEAKTRAAQALAKLKTGAKFEDVVTEFSDEQSAGGMLGRFKRGVQPEPVQTALEKTPVDKFTDVVESDMGFHILLRTQ